MPTSEGRAIRACPRASLSPAHWEKTSLLKVHAVHGSLAQGTTKKSLSHTNSCVDFEGTFAYTHKRTPPWRCMHRASVNTYPSAQPHRCGGDVHERDDDKWSTSPANNTTTPNSALDLCSSSMMTSLSHTQTHIHVHTRTHTHTHTHKLPSLSTREHSRFSSALYPTTPTHTMVHKCVSLMIPLQQRLEPPFVITPQKHHVWPWASRND